MAGLHACCWTKFFSARCGRKTRANRLSAQQCVDDDNKKSCERRNPTEITEIPNRLGEGVYVW